MSQPPQLYKLVLTAQGEVRDVDGNLVSSEPIEAEMTVTAEQVRELTQGETP